MKTYQREFIELALKYKVLQFGEFTLKSGRISPYFFNMGLFNTGNALASLGRYYADTINGAKIDYDVIFGPAYKGIPLVATTAVAFSTEFQKDVSYCFNRKEAKDHGEGGNIIGSPLAGNVLIIDDVITAGTAIREAMGLIDDAGAKLAGVVIALDRQERGQGDTSAIQEIENKYNVPVSSIITLDDLIEYLNEKGNQSDVLERVFAYKEEYGI